MRLLDEFLRRQAAGEAPDEEAWLRSHPERAAEKMSERIVYRYLAKRRNAVPQMYGYELAASRDVYKRIVASIAQREPAMVVWVQPPPLEYATPEQFEAVLLHGYEEVQQFSEGDPATGEEHVVRVYARISRTPIPVPFTSTKNPRSLVSLLHSES